MKVVRSSNSISTPWKTPKYQFHRMPPFLEPAEPAALDGNGDNSARQRQEEEGELDALGFLPLGGGNPWRSRCRGGGDSSDSGLQGPRWSSWLQPSLALCVLPGAQGPAASPMAALRAPAVLWEGSRAVWSASHGPWLCTGRWSRDLIAGGISLLPQVLLPSPVKINFS